MHSHNHHHPSLTLEDFIHSRNSLLYSLFLSICIVFIEIIGAVVSNSLALLSDAFHILTDISSHLISLFALWISSKPMSNRFTFGYGRIEILAAFANSMLLFLLCGFLVYHSIERFFNPVGIYTEKMLYFSIVALFFNVISTYILYRVSHFNINLKSAFLHSFGDMLGTTAVVIGSIVILLTGWVVFDYIITLIIVVIILKATIGIIKEVFYSLMEASPNIEKTKNMVQKINETLGYQGVTSYRHWFLTSKLECFDCQILIKNKNNWESLVPSIHRILKEDFGIHYASVEPVTKESSIVLETIQFNSKNF